MQCQVVQSANGLVRSLEVLANVGQLDHVQVVAKKEGMVNEVA